MSIEHQAQFWDQVTAAAAPIAEAQALIESLLPSASLPGSRVLDAGCGAGDYSAAFLKLGASVVSFDVSVGSLRIARQKVVSMGRGAGMSGGHQGGPFAQASLSHLPYPAGMFDVVWAWGVLHYVPDPVRAVQEAVRVLRPGGGVAVIHTLRRGVWSAAESAAARLFRRAPHLLQTFMLDAGERLIPFVSRVVTGKPPAQHTSKSLRQKLHERLLVPGDVTTFTAATLAAMAGPAAEACEARPPVSDLLRREMSLTVILRRP